MNENGMLFKRRISFSEGKKIDSESGHFGEDGLTDCLCDSDGRRIIRG